jgi:hypothetical protein
MAGLPILLSWRKAGNGECSTVNADGDGLLMLMLSAEDAEDVDMEDVDVEGVEDAEELRMEEITPAGNIILETRYSKRETRSF